LDVTFVGRRQQHRPATYAAAGTVRFDWYDYEQMSGSFKTGAGGAA
jgi:hypothetical protein